MGDSTTGDVIKNVMLSYSTGEQDGKANKDTFPPAPLKESLPPVPAPCLESRGPAEIPVDPPLYEVFRVDLAQEDVGEKFEEAAKAYTQARLGNAEAMEWIRHHGASYRHCAAIVELVALEFYGTVAGHHKNAERAKELGNRVYPYLEYLLEHVTSAKAQLIIKHRLATCLVEGLGTNPDLPRSTELFRQAAEGGFAMSQCSLGYCYNKGEGVERDDRLGVHWYLASAEQGYAMGQYNLAISFEFGEGVEKDLARAVHWYRQAAEQGHAGAQTSLAFCVEAGSGCVANPQEAIVWYQRAADQRHNRALYNLACCYEHGDGVPVDKPKALNYFRIAAEQGMASAQCTMGTWHYFGKGMDEPDHEMAVYWWTLAAEQEERRAQYNLAVCYEHEYGVPRDMAASLRWYREAANGGYVDAILQMGRCCENGVEDHVDVNFKEAADWYQKGRDAGSANASLALAKLYRRGHGVDENCGTAMRMCLEAVDRGCTLRDLNEEVAELFAQLLGGDEETQRGLEDCVCPITLSVTVQPVTMQVDLGGGRAREQVYDRAALMQYAQMRSQRHQRVVDVHSQCPFTPDVTDAIENADEDELFVVDQARQQRVLVRIRDALDRLSL